jgi:hypothetical protein
LNLANEAIAQTAGTYTERPRNREKELGGKLAKSGRSLEKLEKQLRKNNRNRTAERGR